MTLYARLSLVSVLLAVLVVLGFGLSAYTLFVRQQEAQLRALLEQDLARVATLLERPRLGESFAASKAGAFILQFVTPDDRVVLGWGGATPLPLASRPSRISLDDRSYLVTSAAWGATGGTIRLAHDIGAALEARVLLARGLLLSGLLALLLAALVGLVTTRRSLTPLLRLAVEARRIDPASPGAIPYAGPQDEVGALAQALNASLGAIRSQKEEERAFLVEIAHELAAPLTLTAYHLDAVRQDHPGDDRLRVAAAAAQELLRTSQDLLVLARGELERPLELRIVALADLLRRAADEYPGVELRASTAGEVIGDPERLMQVVRNLVRNAVQAAGRATGVRLLLSQDADQQVLEVIDEGPGMSEETLAHAFDRFYSGRRGVGVGLSVAKSLVVQHRGTIHATSSPGAGSRFVVRLPCLAAQIERDPPAAPARPASGSAVGG